MSQAISSKKPFRMIRQEPRPPLSAWGVRFPGHNTPTIATAIHQLRGKGFKDLAWRIKYDVLLEEHVFLLNAACSQPSISSAFPRLKQSLFKSKTPHPR